MMKYNNIKVIDSLCFIFMFPDPCDKSDCPEGSECIANEAGDDFECKCGKGYRNPKDDKKSCVGKSFCDISFIL